MSHFVRPKTALDREALERATSVYLPDRVLPMLPETISNGLASLQPGKVRYTKSAIMEFTDDGLRVSTELYSAAIRSSKRLTYEQVDEFLASLARRRGTVGRRCATASQKQCPAASVRHCLQASSGTRSRDPKEARRQSLRPAGTHARPGHDASPAADG